MCYKEDGLPPEGLIQKIHKFLSEEREREREIRNPPPPTNSLEQEQSTGPGTASYSLFFSPNSPTPLLRWSFSYSA